MVKALCLATLVSAAPTASELDRRFDGTAPLRDAVLSPPVAAQAPSKTLSAEPRVGAAEPRVGAAEPPSYDYARMFDLARRLQTGPQAARVRDFLRDAFRDELALTTEQQERYGLGDKIKEVSTSQLMLVLRRNERYWPLVEQYLAEIGSVRPGGPEEERTRRTWRGRMRALILDQRVKAQFRELNDPLEPMELAMADGTPGYSKARVYLGHPGWKDGAWTEPDDLVRVAIDFIRGAKSELMLNVFDFDLTAVAEALSAKGEEGVPVTVGIDKRVIEERPEVKAVFDRLRQSKNVIAVAVDAVGLNHQKMMVRDWSAPKRAKVLLSSGNLTRSCLSPGGDLAGMPRPPKDAVPNANHMITLESLPAAQAVADSLIKTLDLGLRGGEYPLGGAFKVPGGGDGRFMALAFSPRGGLGDVNRDVIRRVLLGTRGPIRMLQFAFSSKDVAAALLERARLEKAAGGRFDFKSVGDTPFALAKWSAFLTLSGYRLVEGEGPKEYVELDHNPLREILGGAEYEALKRDIRIAPRRYGKHVRRARAGDASYDAKLHHKVLVSGDVVIAGTSFNFSSNADSNNEQMIVFKDPDIVRDMTAAFEGLFRQTEASVSDEVKRRNARYAGGAVDEEAPSPEDGATE